MDLYFAPLACSMATRISLYEAGADARFIQVDTRAKRVADGSDFWTVNPMGMVPAIRLDDGALLTENSAVLEYVADRYPGLAPTDPMQRSRLRQWLGFIGTELHKVIYSPLLDPKADEAVRQYARGKAQLRLGMLDKHLAGREFLLDKFSVADAYLTVVLNWSGATGIDLKPYPAIVAYQQRLQKRPSVAKAMGEEFALYKEQQAKREAAKAKA